jgi:hypothetical protein
MILANMFHHADSATSGKLEEALQKDGMEMKGKRDPTLFPFLRRRAEGSSRSPL